MKHTVTSIQSTVLREELSYPFDKWHPRQRHKLSSVYLRCVLRLYILRSRQFTSDNVYEMADVYIKLSKYLISNIICRA